VARRWNEDVDAAALRLERGGSRFLSECARYLIDVGTAEVLSPALLSGAVTTWRLAGFRPNASLRLFERELFVPQPAPQHAVIPLPREWSEPAAIDRAAFPPRWYLGEAGLAEAYAATPRATLLGIRNEDELVGFAIVGVGMGIAYLQRLAVGPSFQGQGLGRSLVRASVTWARARSARTMLLNTQRSNDPAAGLYLSEGFIDSGQLLSVMSFPAGG
jgi:ribosomal-protein-alanine N-acetyltransferase